MFKSYFKKNHMYIYFPTDIFIIKIGHKFHSILPIEEYVYWIEIVFNFSMEKFSKYALWLSFQKRSWINGYFESNTWNLFTTQSLSIW